MAVDERANLARVKAGWKGGPFFSKPAGVPQLRFVDGWPAGVAQKMNFSTPPTPTPIDVWNRRR